MYMCGSVHISTQACVSRGVAVSFGAGFVGVYGLPENGCSELNLNTPQEQNEILTSEPSPQHQLIPSYSNTFSIISQMSFKKLLSIAQCEKYS